jgi:hypothetical protein
VSIVGDGFTLVSGGAEGGMCGLRAIYADEEYSVLELTSEFTAISRTWEACHALVRCIPGMIEHGSNDPFLFDGDLESGRLRSLHDTLRRAQLLQMSLDVLRRGEIASLSSPEIRRHLRMYLPTVDEMLGGDHARLRSYSETAGLIRSKVSRRSEHCSLSF